MTAGMKVRTTAVDNTKVENKKVANKKVANMKAVNMKVVNMKAVNMKAVNMNKTVEDTKALDTMVGCRLADRMVANMSSCRKLVDRMADRKAEDDSSAPDDIHSSAEDSGLWPKSCCVLLQDTNCVLTVERKPLASN
jgi:hypothetical protein